MGKGAFVKPRRTINLKGGGSSPKMQSSHSRPTMQRSGTPSHHRTINPNEGQEDAVTVDPVYVLPDGSINFWAGMTSLFPDNQISNKEPEDE